VHGVHTARTFFRAPAVQRSRKGPCTAGGVARARAAAARAGRAGAWSCWSASASRRRRPLSASAEKKSARSASTSSLRRAHCQRGARRGAAARACSAGRAGVVPAPCEELRGGLSFGEVLEVGRRRLHRQHDLPPRRAAPVGARPRPRAAGRARAHLGGVEREEGGVERGEGPFAGGLVEQDDRAEQRGVVVHQRHREQALARRRLLIVLAAVPRARKAVDCRVEARVSGRVA